MIKSKIAGERTTATKEQTAEFIAKLHNNPLAEAAIMLMIMGIPAESRDLYRQDLKWIVKGDRAYPANRNTAVAVCSPFSDKRFEGTSIPIKQLLERGTAKGYTLSRYCK